MGSSQTPRTPSRSWFATTPDAGFGASDTYTYAFDGGAWGPKGNVVGTCQGTNIPLLSFGGNTPYLTLRASDCSTWGPRTVSHNGASWTTFASHSGSLDTYSGYSRGFYMGGESLSTIERIVLPNDGGFDDGDGGELGTFTNDTITLEVGLENGTPLLTNSAVYLFGGTNGTTRPYIQRGLIAP